MEQSVSTYKKIRRLYRQSQKYAASRMEQPELTQSELQLLRHVGFHGEVSQRHLADEMGVDKAMISRILQKLEAKGYLVRTEDENDARSKNVRALPPALEIHSQGKGLSEQFFDQVTGDFSTEERELLDQLLGRMLEKGRSWQPLLPWKRRSVHEICDPLCEAPHPYDDLWLHHQVHWHHPGSDDPLYPFLYY